MEYYIKSCKDNERFKIEKDCYKRLEDCSFLPKLEKTEKTNNNIIIEKMTGLTLTQYVKKNSKIPDDFFKQLYEMQSDMIERGVVYNPDWTKFGEHYFIESSGKIKMIDYDSCQISDEAEIKKFFRAEIEKRFAFLFSNSSKEKQEESWKDMKRELNLEAIGNAYADAYFGNRKMIR